MFHAGLWGALAHPLWPGDETSSSHGKKAKINPSGQLFPMGWCINPMIWVFFIIVIIRFFEPHKWDAYKSDYSSNTKFGSMDRDWAIILFEQRKRSFQEGCNSDAVWSATTRHHPKLLIPGGHVCVCSLCWEHFARNDGRPLVCPTDAGAQRMGGLGIELGLSRTRGSVDWFGWDDICWLLGRRLQSIWCPPKKQQQQGPQLVHYHFLNGSVSPFKPWIPTFRVTDNAMYQPTQIPSFDHLISVQCSGDWDPKCFGHGLEESKISNRFGECLGPKTR